MFAVECFDNSMSNAMVILSFILNDLWGLVNKLPFAGVLAG